MRKSRIVGIIASSVAAVGLTALAVTSANAANGAGESDPAGTPAEGTTQPTEPGPPVDLGPGVAVEQTEDGLRIRKLTEEELADMDGAQPTTPFESTESAAE
ncbi:hypothetical protein RM844_17915 [Streptomyces sp. DSM 44915]|uniref:Secreted protein n=1 Tax=Streptomyces chisholmiae TaxID=3075540 RepID=A0ABU2JTB8_9ACTN|nr:hypothetical protein [Streptomyces sp. DSM 44915]MDT0268162.1 hypothetical protein [Streptomyces sp. DSM 44915]